MPNPNRTALLIRCSVEDAELVRRAARRHRQTLSGYVLQALMVRLTVEQRVQEKLEQRNRDASAISDLARPR